MDEARAFLNALREKLPTGIYSLTSTGKAYRIAVQIEATNADEATALATSMGGSAGATRISKAAKAKVKSDNAASTEAVETKNEMENTEEVAKTKKATKAKDKPAKKSAGAAGPRFEKKTACAAPGHGEYGDIEKHNKKHHGGKPYVAKKS